LPSRSLLRNEWLVAGLVAVGMLLAFVLLTRGLPAGGSHGIESDGLDLAIRLARAVHRHTDALGIDFALRILHGPTARRVTTALALLGSARGSLLLTGALGAFLVVRRRWLAAGLLLAGMAGIVAVEGALRLRLDAIPWGDLPNLIAQPYGHGLQDSSYPSGHTARFVFLAGVVAVLLPGRWRAAALVLAIASGMLVGAQRVVTGAHPAVDVAGGFLLGSGSAALYAMLLWKGPSTWRGLVRD
jgi:membrane-associated phospholipid phosphatase